MTSSSRQPQMPPLDSCAYPAAETHLSSPLWLVGAVRREGEREGERERATPTSHRYTVCTPCTACIHVHVYLHVLYMYTPVWEIGGRQVAQATCKRSVATYFDQLVTIPGNLSICSRTLRYSHTTTHIA